MPSLARKATDIPLLTARQLCGTIPPIAAVIATSRIVEELVSGIVDSQTLTIHLLGGFRITTGHEGVMGLNHAAPARAARLSAAAPRAADRRASTWPSSSGPTPPRSRPAPICALCGTACAGPCRTPIAFWRPTSSTMQWRGDAPFWLDVAEFETHLKQARTAAGIDDQVLHLEQAVAPMAATCCPAATATGCWPSAIGWRRRMATRWSRSRRCTKAVATTPRPSATCRRCCGTIRSTNRPTPT